MTRPHTALTKFFHLATAKRPAEELYDVSRDPWQLVNIAADPARLRVKSELRAILDRWMRQTGDPRATGAADPWDRYPYYGQAAAAEPR